jgi:hypothetical protein
MNDIRTKLDNVPAIQVFAIAAMGVGLLVSYFPPIQNGAAIWGVVGLFFGNLMRDLFPAKGDNDPLNKAPAPPSVSSDRGSL